MNCPPRERTGYKLVVHCPIDGWMDWGPGQMGFVGLFIAGSRRRKRNVTDDDDDDSATVTAVE